MAMAERFVTSRSYSHVEDYAPEIDASSDQVAPVAALSRRSASLILGEPGAGKSTALRQMEDALDREGVKVHLIDLRDCHGEMSLSQAFDRIPAAGSENGLKPVLLIDSIDEAPGLIRNYVSFLKQRVGPLVDMGWSVVGVCRTAESVRALDDLFVGLDEGAVHVLLPLRRSDVEELATSKGVDARAFLAEVSRMHLESLAATPFTLTLLLQVFEADSAFPGTRAEVLDRAVTLMLAADTIGNYTPRQDVEVEPLRQRLAAERMAAFSTFAAANSYGLFRVGERSVGIETELLVGVDVENDVAIELTNKDFQRLLRTPLFADSGPNERQFAHRRLRDFLAAKYLDRRKLDGLQLRSILLVSDGEDSIPPQMVDVATWLVSFSAESYEWLVKADPLSLVRNRIGEDVPALSSRLVADLLRSAYSVERILTWRDDLLGLAHPGLAAQLAEALDSSDAEQEVALRVLRDSYVVGLDDAILQIANDNSRTVKVRELAVQVMEGQGLTEQLARLEVSAPSFFDGDDQAQLRGKAIDALWPNVITDEELVQLLVPPVEDFFGSYWSALNRLESEMSRHLAVEILDAGIGDGSGRARRGRARLHDLESLVDRAINVLMEEEQVDPEEERVIAAALNRRMEGDRERLPFSMKVVSEGRIVRIFREIGRAASEGNPAWHSLWLATDSDGDRVLSRKDLAWMAEAAELAESDTEVTLWATLVDRLVDSANLDDLEWAWEQQGTRVWGSLKYRFEPIDLESEGARNARETWRIISERETPSSEDRGMSVEEYTSAIRQAVSTAQADPNAFWHLARWLDVDLSSRRYNYGHEPDLLALPNLDILVGEIRVEVLQQAAAYVRSSPPLPTRPKPNALYPNVRGLYQALHTLQKHAPESLDLVPTGDWARFVPAILDYPTTDQGEVESTRVQLLERANRADSTAFAAALRTVFRRTASGKAPFIRLEGLAGLVSPTTFASLRLLARNGDDHRRWSAFELYLDADLGGASKWAMKRIASGSDDAAEIAALVGVLLERDPDQGYAGLRRLLRRDPEIARAALLRIAERERWGRGFLRDRTGRERMEVFESLVDLFPPGEERFGTGVHSVTPREDLAEWRQAILSSVIRAGTPEAVLALVGTSHRRPDLGLDWAVIAARESFRLSGWFPLTIFELRGVIERRNARLARSDEDVLNLTLAALDEIQSWLTGETPQSFALWDDIPGHRAPKDENRISDWYCHALRISLSSSGLILNREVEVKNPSGRGVGMRQDIRIEVSEEESGQHHVVVVEVKGMWNAGVKSSLETQLVNDYLIGGGLSHGIYLVVDFSSAQMVGSVSKARTSASNRRGLGRMLKRQASQASPAVTVVPVIHRADLPSPSGRR
jgi:hypothetical protein